MQMETLKLQNESISMLECMLIEAERKLQILENVQNLVNATQEEVERMLKDELNVPLLCSSILTLKRAQRSNEIKLDISQMECKEANNAKR